MTSDEMRLRKREEYEMQLFGFHSRAANDGIKNMIREEIQLVCQRLCKSIENKYQLTPEELSLLRTETKSLIHTYENNTNARMEELNNIVKKFISIPDNVLLDEDKGQATQLTEDEYEELNSKMQDLQRRAKRATMFNAALRQELQIQESFKTCEDAIKTACKDIEKNTTLPNLENEITIFTNEAERLDMQLAVLGSSREKDLYNPKIKNLKEFDMVY